MPHEPEFRNRLQSIERLLSTIEAAADPHLRATVQELVRSIMDLHGEGIERMLELIRATPDGGASVTSRLGRDELVGSLLILYGLHPVDFETRVNQAIDKASSRLRPRDADLQLLEIREGAIKLRLNANGDGCGANPQALKEIVENLIYQAAPDLAGLTIYGAEDKQSFVPLEMLLGAGK